MQWRRRRKNEDPKDNETDVKKCREDLHEEREGCRYQSNRKKHEWMSNNKRPQSLAPLQSMQPLFRFPSIYLLDRESEEANVQVQRPSDSLRFKKENQIRKIQLRFELFFSFLPEGRWRGGREEQTLLTPLGSSRVFLRMKRINFLVAL
jgi:hypothetical protein